MNFSLVCISIINFRLDFLHKVRYNLPPKGGRTLWIVSSCCPFFVMRIGRRVIIPANNSLPLEYQEQVDAKELEFADNAVGSKNWRSDW